MTTEPTHGAPSFDCPHCGAHAQQTWPQAVLCADEGGVTTDWSSIDRSECYTCKKETVWHAQRRYSGSSGAGYSHSWMEWGILWPRERAGVPAHERLPEDLRPLYDEAREVADLSPRAAAALLRLLTETLLRQVAEAPKAKPFDLIGQLVREGKLDEQARMLAAYLRITGNNAVHPGQIDEDEDAQKRVSVMFPFVNSLVQRLIADPAEINELYEQLPEEARAAADRRDGRSSSTSESQ